MFDDISPLEWIVIVGGLFLGFGGVRFLLSRGSLAETAQESARAERARTEQAHQFEDAGKKQSAGRGPDAGGTQSESSHWTEVLDVPPTASLNDIRSAYRRKIAQYHPDKVASLGPELKALAEQMAKRINSAHDQAIQEREAHGG